MIIMLPHLDNIYRVEQAESIFLSEDVGIPNVLFPLFSLVYLDQNINLSSLCQSFYNNYFLYILLTVYVF